MTFTTDPSKNPQVNNPNAAEAAGDVYLNLRPGEEFEDVLSEMVRPFASNLSQAIIGLFGDLANSDEAGSIFDEALAGAFDVFGEDLTDLFVRAATEGIGVFKDLDDILGKAAGHLLKSIEQSLPSGMGQMLMGGQQAYQMFGANLLADFAKGAIGMEGKGAGFDIADIIFGGGSFDTIFLPNQEMAQIGVDFANGQLGQWLGLDEGFWGETFGQFNTAGMIGGFVGSSLAGMMGFEGSGNPLLDTGLSLAGSIGGAALGTSLGPLLGSFGGPVGIAIGSFLAPVIGDLFADEDFPFAMANLGIVDGQIGVLKSHELDGGPLKQVQEMADQVSKNFDQILSSLGGRLDGADGTELSRVGYASGRSAALGTGYFAGEGASFASGAKFKNIKDGAEAGTAAVLTLLQTGIEQGVVTGLSPLVAQAINNIDTADPERAQELLTFANNFEATIAAFTEGVGDIQKTIEGQVAQEINAVVNQIEQFRDNTIELGLPLDDANEAMKNYAKTVLGFRNQAELEVTAAEVELRKISELKTLTDTDLNELGLTRKELEEGLALRQQRFTDAFIGQFEALSRERLHKGTGEAEKLAKEFEQALASAALLGIEDTSLIEEEFTAAFQNLYSKITGVALAEAERAHETFAQIGETLREAYNELYFGAGGPGTKEEELAIARGVFDEIASRALAGDEEALAQLAQAGSALVKASQAVFSNGMQTAATREFVLTTLDDAATLAENLSANAAADVARLNGEDLSIGQIADEITGTSEISSHLADLDLPTSDIIQVSPPEEAPPIQENFSEALDETENLLFKSNSFLAALLGLNGNIATYMEELLEVTRRGVLGNNLND